MTRMVRKIGPGRVIRLLVPAALLLGAAGYGIGARSNQGPPFSPEEALKTLRVPDGFRVELVAAEPLVSDPVAIEIDEAGRMYVVEMHGYPLDVGGSGRVMLLADDDADGRADRSTIFAEGLRLPTGIMRWERGVLVTDPPDVLYLEDTDGDGRADLRHVLLTGFAVSNPQHIVNTPLYGLDNWIYVANQRATRTVQFEELFGDQGSEVHFPDRPRGPRLPVNAGGANVRFRPDTGGLEALSAESQFGHTFDSWGHHFLVTNSRHIYQEMVPARYLARNPRLLVPSVVEEVPDYGVPAQVFPITENPEHQMLTNVGVMTAAGGLTYYGADLFPEPYREVAVVTESAHNLVHVAALSEHGVGYRASRIREDREFLASTDPWFRPVNLYVGPDGALYVVDYYRKIIEHPEWLDEATIQSGNLFAGRDRGRIYRVVPEDAPRTGWMGRGPLEDATVEERVRLLSDPNAWWRRNAQRLLVARRAPEAVPLLERMAADPTAPIGAVHALWTLEGMDRLEPGILVQALAHPHAGVRENAIRLAELHLEKDPELSDRLIAMVDDPHPRVRLQLLFTLGELDSAAARDARRDLLLDNLEYEWMQVAGLSARMVDEEELYRIATSRVGAEATPERATFFERLAAMISATGDSAAVGRVIRRATAMADPASDWWRAASLEGLAAGLPRDRLPPGALEAERRLVAQAVEDASSPRLTRAAVALLETLRLPAGEAGERLVLNARGLLDDRDAADAARAAAVRLLAVHGAERHEPLLREILASSEEPASVQVAAVRALAGIPGERIGKFFLGLWPRWTPAVRTEALRILGRDPDRSHLLIAALEEGRVKPGEFEPSLRARLMMAADPTLRSRARAVFTAAAAASAEAGRAAVASYRSALSLDGDPERGRLVFARACSMCHQYGGSGGTHFGPDLAEVRAATAQRLLTSILHPDESIVDGYELWTVELADGTTVSGTLATEIPTSVTLRRIGATELTIPRAQITAMEMAEHSAMPPGLEAAIDPQEMADLIAFIRTTPLD